MTALETWNRLVFAGAWAVISAFRTEYPLAENLDRHAGLLVHLARLGLQGVHVDGRYGGVDETSTLVFGVDPDTARAIGRAFDQESVLTARGLEYCDGSGYLPSAGLSIGTDPDNRSTAQCADGPLPFVSRIDWEAARRVA